MARHLDWQLLTTLSPILAALPERARKPSRVLGIDQGQLLFARGDAPRAMHFVVSGEVRMIRQSRAGGEIVLQRARRGFIAEASLDQQVYHCDALAVAASDALAIPRKSFIDALDDETFRKQWMAHLARELRRVRAQSERLSLRTARERIIHFIEAEGDDGSLALTQSKKDWAAELGLTHEALYRALSEMQRGGELLVKSRLVELTK